MDTTPYNGPAVMASLVCRHCLGEIPPGAAVFEAGAEGAMAFCCPACQGIYHLITEVGLGRFYQQREGWRPGSPEMAWPSAAAFQVRLDGNGAEEATLILSGIRCSSCVWLIERYLAKVPGVVSARVNYVTHRARVRWDPGVTGLDTLLARIAALGYRPLPLVTGGREGNETGERRSLLIRVATAAFFTLPIMLFSVALYEGYLLGMEPRAEQAIGVALWLLATPVLLYSGFPFIRNTLKGVKAGAVSMDTLVCLGSMSAYLYSVFALSRHTEVYFDTSAMIITLILLGRLLEAGARQKAGEAIAALMGLQPAEARAVRSGAGAGETSSLVPVAALAPGDRIEVIPGDAVPFDCAVIEGESEVDEAMLTGEPLPVLKEVGAEVFAGTINLNGRLLLAIKRGGEATVLARIIREVEEAQAGKAPVERIADRVTACFVPVMLTVAALTFVLWHRTGAETTTALLHAISVLVIACPCALGLATPLAVLTGTSLASRQGLLLRGGDVLEALAGVDTVAFDKTGTLTRGRPELARVISYAAEEDELLRAAASLEQHSEHSLARAIRHAAGREGLHPVAHFRTLAGQGVEGMVNGHQAILGSERLLRERGVAIDARQEEGHRELAASGGTVVGLALDSRLGGWFCINDGLRPEAPEVVATLKRAGYGVVLLTGDGPNAALRVAREVGIAVGDVHAGVTPVDKAGIIRQMRAAGQRVLMVGDGINDAPALTAADAGAAMGRATDIAIRSAGAVLMREELGLVVRLLQISGTTFRAIKQNLFWAFSYNLVAVPLAAAGKIHPIISAALMVASSLLVVANSLRLKASRK